jgi:hypothetical protein
MVVQELSFTSGGLLRGNNVGALSVASAADIVAAIGATFVTNATNATNATNTVNVGVTNDAATATPVFLSWVSAASISLPKFQVLIYLLFLLLVFYQQQDSQVVAALTLTAANLTGTISAAVLGNSTFLLVLQQLL